MNFKPLYAWIVLFPLLVGACGGSKDNPELPPPGPQPENPQPGSNPWDANRGKKVQPSGAGWTSTVIDEGIVYYAFEGTESVSNAPQRIFVTDVDLSKSQYEFKLEYYSGRSTASNVFATKNAIAVINGGYERGSIVIWKDGQKYSTMPDNTISDTGVPNWKSEAAVYMDNKRDVRIEFSGKGMSVNFASLTDMSEGAGAVHTIEKSEYILSYYSMQEKKIVITDKTMLLRRLRTTL